MRTIYSEAAGIEDHKERNTVIEHAMRSESERSINAAIALATVEPGIPVLPEWMDSDPWLLTVKNGTVDLRTGKLRGAERDDRITKCCDVDYVEGAECPTFENFLDQIMEGNENLISFLQRAIGYSLTGKVSERSLFILWGTGKNGKSTLLEVLQTMLGDYSLRTPTDTLMVQYGGGSGIPNDIARLKGARFVSASESEEGQRLAESKIKDLTGGDTISARFMRGEFFDFRPEFKLWLATNHKPTIRGTDNAIWDRIKLIPFLVRIPKEQQDPSLPDKLKNELSGILQWAIKGCQEWQKKGLGVPEEVENAVSEYRNEMDILGDFIQDCCYVNEFCEVSNPILRAEYRKWCEKNAVKMLNPKAFKRRMEERGFKQTRDSKARKWNGIRLLEEWEMEQMNNDTSDSMTDDDTFSTLSSHLYSHKQTTGKTCHDVSPVTDEKKEKNLGDFYN